MFNRAGVFAPPYLGIDRKLRLRREWTTQFAIVAIEIEARTERHRHELGELAKPVAECPLVARLCRITTSDRLEVLGGAAGYIEHVAGWCTQFEGAALMIVNVVAHSTKQIDGETAHPGGLHEQPG